MPVSICEWRVRVGTFIHWVRDNEVRERRERRLKERIRRLKVLFERLKAEKGDSQEQPQDGTETTDDNKQFPGHACPHKSASIQSSDNSASIKDLLTSCDLCTKDLLTPNNSYHIKKLLNPPDASNNILPPPADTSIKELLSKTDFCNTVQHTGTDSTVRDLMENYTNVRELLVPSDSGTRDLLFSPIALGCNTLLQYSGCISEQPTQSDTKTKDLLTRVHFDIGVMIPGSCSELQTPCDSDIRDILTLRDSVIYDLLSTKKSSLDESISSNAFSKLLQQDDSFINELLSSRESYISEILSRGDSYTQEIISTGDFNNQARLSPGDLITQDRLPIDDSYIQETILGDSYKQERLSPDNSYIQEILSPGDSNIQEILSQGNSYTQERLSPGDSFTQDRLSAEDCYIRKIISAGDSYTQERLSPGDSYTQEILSPGDSDIQEILSLGTSFTQNRLSPGDSITPKRLSAKESYTHLILSPGDSNTKEEILSPGDSNTHEILSPGESYTHKILSQGDSNTHEILSPGESNTHKILSSGDSNIQEILFPGASFTQNRLSPGDSITQKRLSATDSYTHEILSQGDSNTQEAILSPGDSNTYKISSQGDSNTHEISSPGDFNTHEILSPEESYYQETLSPVYSLINELPAQECLYLNEALTRKGSYLTKLLTPGDPVITDLLYPATFNRHDLGLHTYLEPHIDNVGEHLFLPYPSMRSIHMMEELASIRMKLLWQVASVSECTGNRPVSFSSTVMTPGSILHPSPIFETENKLRCQSTGSPRLGKDMILHYHSSLSEMLLIKAGDVELNPGPQNRLTDPHVLQESELILLAEEIPDTSYTKFCNALGFKHAQCKQKLRENLGNTNEALVDLLCSWKVDQKAGIDCRTVLAGILGRAGLGALESKMVAGGYLAPDTPSSGGYLAPETSPSATIEDTSRPLKDTMTQEQLAQCSEDLKNFYRERMCKIKTDPLDFNSILEFERIYTNLTLLRREMGRTSKTPLEYSSILSTTINGVLPKRLLVEGEGGVGKTTFCSKLALDWVNASSQFQQFEWVLVIPMRKILKDQTIGDIVKKYLSDNNNVTPQQINDYILSHPDKVLIILDGLDEYAGDISVEDSSDICQILRLEKFNQSRVLVTTRPWRAEDIKSDEDMSRSYAFLAVTGFSAANVSTYINKYFQDDEEAGTELIKFIEDNDVIRDNMAPFPIYVAMLCILWKNSDKQKRETIRRLKTFSQLFKQLIKFLKHHYVSKVVKRLQKKLLDPEIAKANSFLLQIGQIAFFGLLERKLSFDEDDFITCKEALETCFGIGVLSRDRQNVSRWEQSEYVQFEAIVFPHKLFQEYVAALHIASLFDTDREQYNTSISQVMYTHPEEYRYLLYFVVAQGNDVGLDIIQRIQQIEEGHGSGTNYFRYYLNQGRIRPNDFLVDVTFEAYDKDTGKTVGQRIFADEQQLTIDEDMSAHTLSGYLFIMEQHGMKSLTLKGRSCGPTVSRDLADILSSSGSLSRLECYNTSLDEEFYRLMKTRASMTVDDSHYSVKELLIDHRFIGDLQRFDITVRDLFPSLEHLAISTLQTVSPSLFKQLKHPSLKVLSIRSGIVKGRKLKNNEGYQVPLTGDPASLGQLFSNSFPKLNSLKISDLVVGNTRCKAILQTLNKHQHFRNIRITHCFTDDELDPLAREIASDSEVEVNLEHGPARVRYGAYQPSKLTSDLMDALCHRTCIRELILEGVICADRFPDLYEREVDSKIEKIVCHLDLSGNQSASRCLGKFISLLPCLTDLAIDPDAFREAFYEEILNRSSSSKIQTLTMNVCGYRRVDRDPTVCGMLGRLLCLLPCLTDLTIDADITFHDQFYEEVSAGASSSKIEKLECYLNLRDNQSASRCLGKFISLLPCLTDLTIDPGAFREAFYEEILNRSSSSKIQTLTMSKNPFGYMVVDRDHSACGMLGRLLCLLPCLKDLTIDTDITFHNQFYEEVFADASSFKIQTLTMITTSRAYKPVDPDPSVCTLLGRFLCLLPCLTDLTIDIDITLHDQFYEELSAGASFSKNPYFRNSKHEVLMQKWSECKHQERLQLHQHQQQQQQDLQLQFILLEQSKIPTLHENSESLEQVTPSLLHHQRSEQPSVQFQNDDQVGVNAEPEHVQPFQGLVQNYPGSSCIPVVRYPLPEAGEYAGNPSLHHVSRGVREPTHLAMGQGSSGLEDQTQNEQTLLVSYSSSDDDDIPSTSGWKTTESRIESGLIESNRATDSDDVEDSTEKVRNRSYGKRRIHSDSEDSADESRERSHRKRRAKTNREPTSP